MPDVVTYKDTVEWTGNIAAVRREHSDGKIVTFKCSREELGTQKPEEYLNRLLSQHLSGTGKQAVPEK